MSPAPRSRKPRLIAGIDEAGLGPLLGPLTLGYSVLALEQESINLWEALSDTVAREPSADATHLIVADSKRVYARNPRGRRRLETTSLGFLAQRSIGPPRNGPDLLRSAPESIRPRAAEVSRHPWYAELSESLPVWTDPGRLELRAEGLRRDLEAHGVRVIDAGLRLIPAGELNHSFKHTGNKSATVWFHLGAILRHLWLEHAHRELHIIVDRQGGRFRYGRQLAQAFPGARLSIGVESPNHSEYQLVEDEAEGDPPRSMRLTFAEKAEDRAFTVALGSCLAKYGREMAMEAFNRYFQGLQPDLAPTAGYTTDGRRWVRDAASTLEKHQIDRDLLIRQR